MSEPGDYSNPALSPDEKKVIVSRADPQIEDEGSMAIRSCERWLFQVHVSVQTTRTVRSGRGMEGRLPSMSCTMESWIYTRKPSSDRNANSFYVPSKTKLFVAGLQMDDFYC